jgi:hypothetical protein
MPIAAALLLGVVSLGLAQGQEYALKDYMPQTVGSKWVMKTDEQQGEATTTIEVSKPAEGQQGLAFLTKGENGAVIRGSMEAVTDAGYTLFGTIRVPRGQPGGQPTPSPYNPPVVFPAKLQVGQPAEAKTKMSMRGQDVDATMKLELAAVESVTVPKGTFPDCLKLVVTTTTARGELKRTAWYAKGVGLVKTEQPGFGPNATARVAELVDYTLAQ